jgi:hypothetical protein
MLLQICDIVKTVVSPRSWSLPPPRRDIQPACLTDLFSQIPEFCAALLQSSRSAITQLNRALTSMVRIPPSEETRRMSLYSSVSLAVDRGALFLSGRDVVSAPLLLLKARSEKRRSDSLRLWRSTSHQSAAFSIGATLSACYTV